MGRSTKLGICGALALTALLSAPVLAQNSATGRLQGLNINNGEPIQIESDKLEVLDAEHKANFIGNVMVKQGTTVMKTAKMVVFYAQDGSGSSATGSGNIDRMEVSGGVYIQSNDQVATGDQGTFDMNTEVVTLSGKQVVLSQGKTALMGCTLTVEMKSGKAEVNACSGGKVQMVIDPKGAPGAQAGSPKPSN
jgi:lipopolysaccharide export system protein LptA